MCRTDLFKNNKILFFFRIFSLNHNSHVTDKFDMLLHKSRHTLTNWGHTFIPTNRPKTPQPSLLIWLNCWQYTKQRLDNQWQTISSVLRWISHQLIWHLRIGGANGSCYRIVKWLLLFLKTDLASTSLLSFYHTSIELHSVMTYLKPHSNDQQISTFYF